MTGEFAALGDQVVPGSVGEWLANCAPEADEAVLAVTGDRGHLAVSPSQTLEFQTCPEALPWFRRIPEDFANAVQPEWKCSVRVAAAPFLEALLRYSAFLGATPSPDASCLSWDELRLHLTVTPTQDSIALSPWVQSEGAGLHLRVLLAAQVECGSDCGGVEVWINRHYLVDAAAAIAQSGGDGIEIRLTDGLQVVTFRPTGEATPVAAVMPMTPPDSATCSTRV